MSNDIINFREYILKDRQNPSELKNISYRIKKYSRLARNVFKHSDKTLDYDLIEKYLFEHKHAIIFKDDILGKNTNGYVICWGNPTEHNINGIPTKYELQYDFKPANIDYRKSITTKECVVIYDTCDVNIGRIDSLFIIADICDTNETIRQQIFNQKTPLMAVSGSKTKNQKVVNTVVEIAKNVKMLNLESKDDLKDLQILDFNAPLNVDVLQGQLQIYENEILTYIGCDNNIPQIKKERLITDEVNSNDEILNYLLIDCLNARNKGNDQLKKMFGIDNKTEINKIIRPIMTENENKDKSDDNNKNGGI